MARLVRWLMEELGFDGRNNVLLIVLAELTKIVNGFWREDNAKHRGPRIQHDRTHQYAAWRIAFYQTAVFGECLDV